MTHPVIKTYSTSPLADHIATILNSPELQELTPEQIEKLAKSLIIDDLKDKLRSEVKKATIDLEELNRKWISTFASRITQVNYRHNVEVFIQWLGTRSVIELKASDADDYLLYLKNAGLSAGTIRFRIAAASSFLLGVSGQKFF